MSGLLQPNICGGRITWVYILYEYGLLNDMIWYWIEMVKFGDLTQTTVVTRLYVLSHFVVKFHKLKSLNRLYDRNDQVFQKVFQVFGILFQIEGRYLVFGIIVFQVFQYSKYSSIRNTSIPNTGILLVFVPSLMWMHFCVVGICCPVITKLLYRSLCFLSGILYMT